MHSLKKVSEQGGYRNFPKLVRPPLGSNNKRKQGGEVLKSSKSETEAIRDQARNAAPLNSSECEPIAEARGLLVIEFK